MNRLGTLTRLRCVQGSFGALCAKTSHSQRQLACVILGSQRSFNGNSYSTSSGGKKSSWTSWISLEHAIAVTGASIVIAYFGWGFVGLPGSGHVHALKSKRKDDEVKSIKLTSRERRFLRFASVEYDGQLYMTPQDFLESVVEAEPRPRVKRKTLTKKELEIIRDMTPTLQKGSPQMFRNLRDKGIVSYTEYLFLLSILTKPQTGFRIAFNMFDTDGNEKVDKSEFLVLERIFSMAWKEKRGLNTTGQPGEESSKEKDSKDEPPKEGQPDKDKEKDKDKDKDNQRMEDVLQDILVDDDRGLQRRHFVDTTLLLHFFGPKGKREIRFEDFKKFMEDLQTEVQELEFHEFSKGLDTISQVDFAKILLRYTYLESDDYELYLDRLVERIKLEQGITFLEFRAFCQFLNNLDDFNVAMRMYTLADRPISQDEFRRAVRICTGTDLSPHVVETVFQIFDEDDDGHLSHREFIGVMKDRLHRGFKLYTKSEGWEAFKLCLKQEMRTQ